VKVFRIAAGHEFRTLPRRAAAGRGAYPMNAVVLSPDGRLLAVTTEEGTCALVDPTGGAELAVIPLKRTLPFAFESSGSLLTCGSAGLFRWPVRTDPATGLCRFGPAQLLLDSKRQDGHASSDDGRVVAIPNYEKGALLLRRDQPGPPTALAPQEDVRFCSVSPDGRWVATGNHWNTKGIGAKIWDADDGRLVKDLPSSGSCGVRFSPDGKWLVAATEGRCRLLAVGTWEEKLNLGRDSWSCVFSPDGRMLALAGEPGVIHLVELVSGQEYVRIDAPEQTRLNLVAFTRDGAQLIALGSESQALHVWDLRAIRRQLKALNLDWDAPEYPPELPPVHTPLKIEVVP
jgi:WD40 repeat protein